MNKILYELHWHYCSDNLVGVTVTPIKVIRQNILPDCFAVSITAIDSEGNKFQGSADNYYETEELAMQAAKKEITEAIKLVTAQISKLENQLNALVQYKDTIL